MLNFYINTEPKDLIDNIGAIAPAIVGFFSILIAATSIVFTYFSIKQQKEQWLQDAYIKNEANVLLEAKKQLIPVIESVRSLYGTTFSKMSLYMNSLERPLPSTMDDKWKKELFMSFKSIKNLYNFFIDNDNIFIKHDLDKSFDYLKLYLQLLNFIPKDEILETIEIKDSIIDLNKNIEKSCTIYRYTIWYKIIFSAYEWKNGGIRTFGPANAFVSKVNDEIINEVELLFYEAIKCLEKTQEYLNKKTVFENNNIIENQKRKRWYLDFKGKLFSQETEE